MYTSCITVSLNIIIIKRCCPILCVQAVDQVLAQVQLLERCGDFARMYSGGMKRRLSVALSTVGDVQIIFLDGTLSFWSFFFPGGRCCFCIPLSH